MEKLEDGCYGSLKGIALIAKVLAGRCQMHYTRVAAGKGAIPEGQSPKTLSVPQEYVMDAQISSVSNPVDGECQVSVQINSAYVKAGFYVTWLILYAEDPDEGEVPYTALCLENEPEWIRPSSSIVGKLAHFDIIAAVGDVDTVSASVSPDALVTHKELSELLRGLGTARLDVTIPATGWAPDDDTGGAYQLRCDIAIDNVTDRMIPTLTIWPEYTEAAGACRMSSAVRTVQGGIRVYAQTAPLEAIQGSLTLTGVSDLGEVSGEGGGVYALPIATATMLGAVRIKEGSGLIVDDSGNLAIDAAAEQEIADTLSGSAAGTTK